jgi:hypothetical protein
MAEAEGPTNHQPIIGPGGPLFKWARGVPIEDDRTIEAPILQDKNEVEIIDVITVDGDDEGADNDFDNSEITPESSGEEVDMGQNEQEAEKHVANEHVGHVQNKDYELDVGHDEYEVPPKKTTRLVWSRQWTERVQRCRRRRRS